jgi:DNA-binding MarR family transcriptional regulator
VSLLAARWIERLLAQHDPPLTVAQYLALRAIEREGVSGTELARRSGVSGPAVSQLLTGLADEGLVERQPVEGDRRRMALTLSPAGRRALTGAERTLRKQLGSLLSDLPRPEADALALRASGGRGHSLGRTSTAPTASASAAASAAGRVIGKRRPARRSGQWAEEEQEVRLAIVGAGVSGLVCAHLLSERHDVTLYEANDYAGGHTNTVRVDAPDETHRVDTGFIVLNDRTYPNFERLLARLGVARQRSDMSFSVSDGGDFEYNGSGANGLFARRSHLVRPSFHRMIRDLMRFNREAPALVGLNGSGPSLGEFLDDGGYSQEFVKRLIVPQASAVWSADPKRMWEFPASMLAEFFANHGMFGLSGRPNWLTITGGSDRYVEAITRPLGDRLRLSTPVRRVERHDDAWRSRRPAARPSASTR